VTEISTATIKINPVIDIEGLDAGVRAAVAQVLRKMADEMDTPADTREPALWGYHIGDRVKYTESGMGAAGLVRVIGAVKRDGNDAPYLRLDAPGFGGIGHAFYDTEITFA
jgi:hypothetical protein